MKIKDLLNEMYSPHLYLSRVVNAFRKMVLNNIDTGSIKKQYDYTTKGEWTCTYKGDGDLKGAEIMPSDGRKAVGQWILNIIFKSEDIAKQYQPKMKNFLKEFERDADAPQMKFRKEDKKKWDGGFALMYFYNDPTDIS